MADNEDIARQPEDPLNESLSGETKASMAARIGLNDNKAGMEGLDKEKINRIIYEASKGSKFYQNELKKDKVIQAKIESLKNRLSHASESQLKECQDKADALLASLHSQYDFTRYIVHMDMDAFYAAVEMRDNPALRDVPMAVGGESMLSTSNYVARRYGVRAAMPGFIARKLCPHLVLVPVNMTKYTAVSRVIRKILIQYDPEMTPMSLDEAYIDFTEHMTRRSELSVESRTLPEYSDSMCRCEGVAVTGRSCDSTDTSTASSDESTLPIEPRANGGDEPQSNKHRSDQVCPSCGLPPNPHTITFGLTVEEAVREMRHRIHLKTQLTASAGIAANSLLAKISSDKNKPNGQYMLPFTVEAVQEFIQELPIRKIPGIGKVSEKQLVAFGVETCGDFYKHRDVLAFLYSGGSFEYFMSVYMGLGSNCVARSEEGPKSKSVERTFRSLSEPNDLMNMCYELSMELAEDLKAARNLVGKTVTLKIKLVTFELKTRAQSLASVTNDGEEIFKAACNLLKTEIKNAQPKPLALRLMGVRMSNFASEDAKQTKLKMSKVATPSKESFFDMMDKEKTTPKVVESLGLLAYMTDPSSLVGKMAGNQSLSNKRSGLDRFSMKRKDVWDVVSHAPTKRAKAGTKGAVSICSLLDSDSTTDPWEEFERQHPPSSTPHSKRREVDGAEGRPPSVSAVGSPKCKKTVESYFTKTRSVWDDVYPSSDDEIVCISDSKHPRKRVKDNQKRRRRGGKSAQGGKELRKIQQSNLRPTRSSGTRVKSARTKASSVTDCEVITLDSD